MCIVKSGYCQTKQQILREQKFLKWNYRRRTMEISTKATAVKLLLFLYLFLLWPNMNLSEQQRHWLSYKKFTSKEPIGLLSMILPSN